MEFNFLAFLVAAIVPLITGFIWYNPKTFGTAWARVAEMTEEKMKSGNMAVIFIVTLVLSFVLAFMVQFLVIHEMGAFGMVEGDTSSATYQAFMEEFGGKYRTFKHGALHGAMSGLFFVLPILGINALFERKGWKYILINTGYWVLTIAIMGAIISGWK
ncbi:DUF1761 domain-containing protein [Psychroserpens sp. XS_ASV72]|uniref:DUF1761 domain-containing protein n=1 Tax=Psychroserpens sp. XS_ASV72 TaxID=3241293 RepID=UPI003518553C